MNPRLFLLLLPMLAGVPAHGLRAATEAPGAGARQHRSELRAALQAQKAASQPPGTAHAADDMLVQPAGLRRLSPAERAELRDQLRQSRPDGPRDGRGKP